MAFVINGIEYQGQHKRGERVPVEGVPDVFYMEGAWAQGVCYSGVPDDPQQAPAHDRTVTMLINGETVTVQHGRWHLEQTGRPMKFRVPGKAHPFASRHMELIEGTRYADPSYQKGQSNWARCGWDAPHITDPETLECYADQDNTGSVWNVRTLPGFVWRWLVMHFNDGQENPVTPEDFARAFDEIREFGGIGVNFTKRDGTPFFIPPNETVGSGGYRKRHWAGSDLHNPACGDSTMVGGGWHDVYSRRIRFGGYAEDGGKWEGETGGPVSNSTHFQIDRLALLAIFTGEPICAEIAKSMIRGMMSLYVLEWSQGQERGHGWAANAVGLSIETFGLYDPAWVAEAAYYAEQIASKLESFNVTGPDGTRYPVLQSGWNPDALDIDEVVEVGGGGFADLRVSKTFMVAILCMGLLRLWNALRDAVDTPNAPDEDEESGNMADLDWPLTKRIRVQLDTAAWVLVVRCCAPQGYDKNFKLEGRTPTEVYESGDAIVPVVGCTEYAGVGGKDGIPIVQQAGNNGLVGVHATFTMPALALLASRPPYALKAGHRAAALRAFGQIAQAHFDQGLNYWGGDEWHELADHWTACARYLPDVEPVKK